MNTNVNYKFAINFNKWIAQITHDFTAFARILPWNYLDSYIF